MGLVPREMNTANKIKLIEYLPTHGSDPREGMRRTLMTDKQRSKPFNQDARGQPSGWISLVEKLHCADHSGRVPCFLGLGGISLKLLKLHQLIDFFRPAFFGKDSNLFELDYFESFGAWSFLVILA